MNRDRFFLLCLMVYTLWFLAKPHRKQLRRIWQRSQERLPRRWKPSQRRALRGISAQGPHRARIEGYASWFCRRSSQGMRSADGAPFFLWTGPVHKLNIRSRTQSHREEMQR